MSNNVIPYGKQDINQEDLDAVAKVLTGEFLTQGPAVLEFEQAFANYVGAKYAVAVSNGTTALHLAALALNVSEETKVLATPITFVASSNCIQYAGGEVHFVDIDPKTYLIDLEKVEEILNSNPSGTFSGIVPVDFAGYPVNMGRLKEIASKHKLWIIEDACHAPGATYSYNNQTYRCGDCAFSDLTVFSFHPVKHIACGEGGMITTNSEETYTKLMELRTHGITRNAEKFKNEAELIGGQNDQYPGWYMEMQELGFNYRMTDLQSALGTSQLKRADKGLEKRRAIAQRYADFFSGKPYILGHSGSVEGHAYHLYVIEVENRLELYNFLRSNQIFCQVHYIPSHMMPYYAEKGWKVGDLPIAENYYSRCLSIPMYPTLTLEEQTKVMNLIDQFYA